MDDQNPPDEEKVETKYVDYSISPAGQRRAQLINDKIRGSKKPESTKGSNYNTALPKRSVQFEETEQVIETITKLENATESDSSLRRKSYVGNVTLTELPF